MNQFSSHDSTQTFNLYIQNSATYCDNKKRFIEYFSYFLITVGVLLASLLGAAAFSSLVSSGLFWTILVFVAGVLVDYQVYSKDFPKLLKILFLRGLFYDLKFGVITAELKKDDDYSYERKSGQKYDCYKKDKANYFDRWIYIRRHYPSNVSIQSLFEELVTKENFQKHQSFINFCIKCEQSLKKRKEKYSLSSTQTIFSQKIRTYAYYAMLSLGVPLSGIAGLGMYAIAYIELNIFLAPFISIVIINSIAIVAAILWALVMYKTFYIAIKKSLRRSWEDFFQLSAKKRALTVLVLFFGLITVIASCAVHGSAIQVVLGGSDPLIGVLIILMIITQTLFMLEHAVGLVIEAMAWDVSSTALKEWFTKEKGQDLSCLQIALKCVLTGVILLLTAGHVVAEASLNMCGGEAMFWERFFKHYEGMTAIIAMIVVVMSVNEFLEHLDFSMKQIKRILCSVLRFFSKRGENSFVFKKNMLLHRKIYSFPKEAVYSLLGHSSLPSHNKKKLPIVCPFL